MSPASARRGKEQRPAPSQSFEFETVLRRCNGNPTLTKRLIRKFAGKFDDYLGALRQAIDAGRARHVSQAAHKLKGAAATLSAEPIRVPAEQLEKLTDGGEMQGSPALLSEIECAMTAYRRDAELLPAD